MNVEVSNQNVKPDIAALISQTNANKNRQVGARTITSEKRSNTEESKPLKEKKEEKLILAADSTELTPKLKYPNPKPIRNEPPQKTSPKLSIQSEKPPIINLNTSPKKGFLPPLDPQRSIKGGPVYSLVLDLDETLVHYEEVMCLSLLYS